MKGQGVLISALVFALVIAVFAVINVDTVHVNFLFTEAALPLIIVILLSTLLGGLTVGLIGIVRQFRLQRTIKALEKQVLELTADGAIIKTSTPLQAESKEATNVPSNE